MIEEKLNKLLAYIQCIMIIFISIFVLLTRSKATEALYRASNYPELLPEIPRYCFPVEIFYFGFLVFIKIGLALSIAP